VQVEGGEGRGRYENVRERNGEAEAIVGGEKRMDKKKKNKGGLVAGRRSGSCRGRCRALGMRRNQGGVGPMWEG